MNKLNHSVNQKSNKLTKEDEFLLILKRRVDPLEINEGINERIIVDLENAYIDIVEFLKDEKRGDLQKFNWARTYYYKILEEQERIIKLWYPVKKNLSSLEEIISEYQSGTYKYVELSAQEHDEIDQRNDYHRNLLDIVEQVVVYLLEYIITLFPQKYYKNETFIKLIQNKLPYYSVPKQVFLSAALKRKNQKLKTSLSGSIQDLFKEASYASPALKLLHNLEKPILDKENNYIGSGVKAIFVFWIERLRYEGFIKNELNQDQIIAILNSSIGNLNLGVGGSEFRKTYKLFDSAICDDLKESISQFSHKVKSGKL